MPLSATLAKPLWIHNLKSYLKSLERLVSSNQVTEIWEVVLLKVNQLLITGTRISVQCSFPTHYSETQWALLCVNKLP